MDKHTFTIYMAGLVDGEGTILINKYTYKGTNHYNPRYSPTVRINMCDAKPLTMAQAIWGGSIHHNLISKKNPNWRDTFMWQTSSKLAYVFLDAIYPYLLIKKRQADVLYQLREIKKLRKNMNHNDAKGVYRPSGRKFDDADVLRMELLFKELKQLKKTAVL